MRLTSNRALVVEKYTVVSKEEKKIDDRKKKKMPVKGVAAQIFHWNALYQL